MKRLEGNAKLLGREQYVDDLQVEGCLWGMTVRSPVARGRIKEIRFSPEIDWSEFVIVDHRDIPGANEVFLIEKDQPVLCAGEVRHVHEAVVLLAHPSREMARKGVRGVEVVVEELPAALDFRVEAEPARVQWGEDNSLSRLSINKGDVEAALASAAHVVEGVYESGAQEHVYLENQGMISWVDDDGVVVVQGSMQCPYYVLNALTHALGRDEAGCRVVQAPTGGGFGGKEDYPSNIACHAALLAMKAQKPVKIVYDRGEDMASTTKRHPSRVRHRTGVDESGRLVAQDIEVTLDGGAYVTLSPVVLSRGIIHAAGPYSCDNVRINGRAVLTNSVPYGAFRGFGAPQTLFALERHMDVVAKRIGMTPEEFRRINLIRDGQSTSTGQVIDDGTDRVGVMERGLELAAYERKREEHASFNATHDYLRRGIGFASFYHGAGFTGAGEVYLASKCHVAGLADGTIEVLTANTEMGQGATTVFLKIAAEAAGVDVSQVVIATPDTHRVPNSGPTVASRTSMVVGKLIEKAIDDLRAQIGAAADAKGAALTDAIRAWCSSNGAERVVGRSEYEKPPEVVWDEKTYTGHAYGTFAWATYVAEVEVDLRTDDVRVIDFVAVQEIGKVLNETLARGQIQGGVVQGIGWALMEECKWRDGAMANNQMTNYIIPTADDVCPIRVEFMENPYAHGAQGAKGIGELPIDGPAPAILNAVADALDVEPTAIPLTPEHLMELAREAHV